MSTEKIAKIDSTFLGIEDHGIFTVYLQVSYGGSGQGIGGFALDEPVRDENDKFLGRRGTAYGMEFIKRTIEACGVDTWEKVKGRTILVLFGDDDGDSWSPKPLGIAPLPTESGKTFLFADLRDMVEEDA